MMRISRPRRPPRIELFAHIAPFYFVTFNTRNRAPLLANCGIHEHLRTFCDRGLEIHRVAVGRYVIMPEHVHLFLFLPPYGITLVRWISMLRTVLGKELLR